jgi:hypothetical protein
LVCTAELSLEGRARAAVLDFGGRLSPEALRLLA